MSETESVAAGLFIDSPNERRMSQPPVALRLNIVEPLASLNPLLNGEVIIEILKWDQKEKHMVIRIVWVVVESWMISCILGLFSDYIDSESDQ